MCSSTLAHLACVQRAWRYRCQTLLFRSIYFTNQDQIMRFTKSLLYHMGPRNSASKLQLERHVRHIYLDMNEESISGHMDLARIHHQVLSILPLLQSLNSFTYAMCHWDCFVVHRTIGHYISQMAPLSLTKICLVVCFCLCTPVHSPTYDVVLRSVVELTSTLS